jgi:hypothetical protein
MGMGKQGSNNLNREWVSKCENTGRSGCLGLKFRKGANKKEQVRGSRPGCKEARMPRPVVLQIQSRKK